MGVFKLAKSGKKKIVINGLSSIEAEIMHIVWRDNKITVREVHEELLENGYVPYTTIMAAMNNLALKGLLKQSRKNKAYVYSPALSNIQVANNIIDTVVEKILKGSPSLIIGHLLKIKNKDDIEKLLELREQFYAQN